MSSGVRGRSVTLTGAMISQTYVSISNDCIVHLKYVHFGLLQLYLNIVREKMLGDVRSKTGKRNMIENNTSRATDRPSTSLEPPHPNSNPFPEP